MNPADAASPFMISSCSVTSTTFSPRSSSQSHPASSGKETTLLHYRWWQQVLEFCLRCKTLLSSFLEKQSINTTAGLLPVYSFPTSLMGPLSSWCGVSSLIEFSEYRKGVSRALLRKLLKLTQKISIYVSLTRR